MGLVCRVIQGGLSGIASWVGVSLGGLLRVVCRGKLRGWGLVWGVTQGGLPGKLRGWGLVWGGGGYSGWFVGDSFVGAG